MADRMANVKRVSPAEARALQDEGFTYVDVRSEPEFLAGHPTGSVNVPLLHMGAGGMTPNPEFLTVMEAAFAKDAKIVLGCRSGGRSLRAAEELIRAGFTNVVDQRAGYEGARGAFGEAGEAGWAPAGLPTEQGPTPGATYADVKAKKR
jgi:rhodanese-related sulfurtransferase